MTAQDAREGRLCDAGWGKARRVEKAEASGEGTRTFRALMTAARELACAFCGSRGIAVGARRPRARDPTPEMSNAQECRIPPSCASVAGLHAVDT